MVVALLALSLVMILGGVAAMVQGFPYVRLESGLAMVIGGSTAASAGVILLGLSAVVDRLRRVQRAIARLRTEGFGPAAATVAWPSAPTPAPVADVTERPALAAGLAGLAGLTVGAARAGGRGTEPAFEDPAPPAAAGVRDGEPLLPDLLPEAGPSPKAAPEDEDLFTLPAEPPKAPEPEQAPPTAEAVGLRSSLEEAPAAPEPQPAEPTIAPSPPPAETEVEAAPAPSPERHAVGSYASGANTYVMFSDGSIEADTPRGRFTFASLDELKGFVNAGGEEARGAA